MVDINLNQDQPVNQPCFGSYSRSGFGSEHFRVQICIQKNQLYNISYSISRHVHSNTLFIEQCTIYSTSDGIQIRYWMVIRIRINLLAQDQDLNPSILGSRFVTKKSTDPG